MGQQIKLEKNDRVGLVKPAVDAHTLGISSVQQILDDCGVKTLIADVAVCQACNHPENSSSMEVVRSWILSNGITVLGFSYRLDPEDGSVKFKNLVRSLLNRRMLAEQGGRIRALFFAGLPKTCELVMSRNPELTAVFPGDETPAETLHKLGIDANLIPAALTRGSVYDEARMAFGREIIAKGEYLSVKAVRGRNYPEFGMSRDSVVARVRHGCEHNLPPLMRAHVGPYLPAREEAVKLFIQWTKQLASSGLLDVLSIGTSQLSQSDFEQDWRDKPNGGGVPLNSKLELSAIWQVARPMLVRTYAGTRNIPQLAEMYEETISMAWHALSLWWFCQIDGRGPYSVLENLQQHIKTLAYIAGTGKPFEANVSHHFAFRGADDVTYIVSAVLAARLAKRSGIRTFILQNMLNTPKYTWGIQDLAKSRALLQLVRELEDGSFRVILQPRGGLDYFSHDLEKAKVQLAAVTALMDDIEPHDNNSPQIIHVVSYSEASHLADPEVIDESIQITRHTLREYRRLREKGLVDDMGSHPEVAVMTQELIAEARCVLQAIESAVPNPYSAEGLYKILADGYLPVPYLWECREEFRRAASWQTRLCRGSVKVVDARGKPIRAADRMRMVSAGR